MNTIPRLILISDFNSFNYRISLRFKDTATDEFIGPKFANRDAAADWYRDFIASFYDGHEKRSSKRDRRIYSGTRQVEQRQNGRRLVDQGYDFEDRAKWILKDIATLQRALESKERGHGA